MALIHYTTFAVLLLADLCYFVNSVPIFVYREAVDDVPVIYIRPKRSDAVAFSGATASGFGGNLPFDAGVIPRIARGDFSDLDFNFVPPSFPPGAQVVSRFGEGEGDSVHVSGRAQGPNAAFSATSAAADSTGKVKYGLKTAQY